MVTSINNMAIIESYIYLREILMMIVA